MIIIELMGGLGNQLQQYAFYRRLKSEGVDVKIDISWFDEKNQQNMEAKRRLELGYIQGVEVEVCTEEEKNAVLGLTSLWGKIKWKMFPKSRRIFHESDLYHEDLVNRLINKSVKNLYISGYFACEYYYADMLPTLRKEFEFPVSSSSNKLKIVRIAAEMKDRESVSVHIRRGDYLDAVNAAMFGNICTDEYYEAAIRLCLERIERPKFYIFSDDEEYAQAFAKSLQEQYPDIRTEAICFNKGDESFFDIYMMSCCQYNICANSTFSFWGSRLNSYENKIAIRPTIHANNQTFDLEKMYTWWKGWTFISPKGDVYGRKK